MRSSLAPYFGKGYPIFGTNAKAASLSSTGRLAKRCSKITVSRRFLIRWCPVPRRASRLICAEDKPYVLKPWGGDADKSMTCVPAYCNEAVYMLEKWKRDGSFKGQLMMQEKVDGVEMGIAGWFGPGGWSSALEESFEHKKFMNDDLGENTGEQGTVIRHVKKSKLFDLMLAPLTDYLHMIRYVGDCEYQLHNPRAWTAIAARIHDATGLPRLLHPTGSLQGDPVDGF